MDIPITDEMIVARAAEFVAAAECFVLALTDEDGYPTAATITPSKVEGIRQIYFGNHMDSNWVRRVAKCGRASICFHSVHPECNVTLVGDIKILTGLELKTEMWREWMAMYYSGPEDPKFCVLKFETLRYSLYVDGTQVRRTL